MRKDLSTNNYHRLRKLYGEDFIGDLHDAIMAGKKKNVKALIRDAGIDPEKDLTPHERYILGL